MENKNTKVVFTLSLILASIIILLALISNRSGYSVTDVKSLNWDIALMLTPYGFLHNLVLLPEHYLRPYYAYPAERGSLLQDSLFKILVIANFILCLVGLYAFRRSVRNFDV